LKFDIFFNGIMEKRKQGGEGIRTMENGCLPAHGDQTVSG
jgi:hypothetical protein